jgi:hypothetical protein
MSDMGVGWMNGRGGHTPTRFPGYAHRIAFFPRFARWAANPHHQLVAREHERAPEVAEAPWTSPAPPARGEAPVAKSAAQK